MKINEELPGIERLVIVMDFLNALGVPEEELKKLTVTQAVSLEHDLMDVVRSYTQEKLDEISDFVKTMNEESRRLRGE